MNYFHPTIKPLIVYVAWTVFVGILVISIRTAKVLMGKKKSNEFPAWEKHGEGFYWRLQRSHVNCLENLPIFATLCIISVMTIMNNATFTSIAWIAVGGRLFQTFSHWSGDG